MPSAPLAFTALAVVVSAAGAIVVGFPVLSSFHCLQLPASIWLAFFTKKSVPSYFAFVVLGSLMVTWFVMHNFWDLNIWMAGMSLKSFCKLVILNVVLALTIPGLALLPSKLHFLTEIGLVTHALLLCHIENQFFNYSGIYYYGFEDDVMYPSYMVLVTTFVGLALVRRLSVDHRIGAKAIWILTCLYSAKLGMLVISSKSVVWMSAILLLAATPPLLLYKDELPERWWRFKLAWLCMELPSHNSGALIQILNAQKKWMRQEDAKNSGSHGKKSKAKESKCKTHK